MTHGYATQASCFHVKYTHRYILYTHTTMRYRCEILNHGIAVVRLPSGPRPAKKLLGKPKLFCGWPGWPAIIFCTNVKCYFVLISVNFL